MKRTLPNYFPATLAKKVLLGGFLAACLHGSVFAAPAGYDYRTRQNGNWNDIATWERTPAGTQNWAQINSSVDLPDATAGLIRIEPNHIITLTSSVAADEITVAAGGLLTLSNSTLTIAPGAATGISVAGTLITQNNLVAGAGNFELANGGQLNIGSPAGISASGTTGNIQVSGIRTFNQGASYIYDGTMAQVTGSGLPTAVGTFGINNSAGVTLSGPVTVGSELLLVEGVISTNTTAKLLVASSGSITYPIEGFTSYVEGSVGIEVSGTTGTITFPTGSDQVYKPVSLSVQQAAGTTVYEAREISQAAPIYTFDTNTIDRVSDVRYYAISASNNSFQEGFLTLPIREDDMVMDLTTLRIAYGEGGVWFDMGVSGVSGTIDNGFITAEIFGLGEFSLANQTGGTNTLPVTLSGFTARHKGQAVVIDWATASEKNNAGFEVQKSRNAMEFETISVLAGTGTSNTGNRYQALDKQPYAGVTYYRLKQIDLDGTFTYSQVISVQTVRTEGAVTVYPNPAIGQVQVVLNGSAAAKLMVRNMLGQTVLQQNVAEGTGRAELGLEGMPAGIYSLYVEQNGGLVVKSFIKK